MLTIIVPLIYAMCAGIIGNFFSIHLVNNVNLPYTAISAVVFITTPVTVVCTVIWTVILQKRHWMKCLAFAYVGYAIAWFSNVFITADSQYFYYIATILGNLFNPCMTMVAGNIIYMKMSESNRTAYLGFYTVATTLFTFIGQWIGTTFVKYTGDLMIKRRQQITEKHRKGDYFARLFYLRDYAGEILCRISGIHISN